MVKMCKYSKDLWKSMHLKDIEKFEKKLSNPGFLKNAPAAVVESDTAKLAGFKEKRATYADSVSRLKELAT